MKAPIIDPVGHHKRSIRMGPVCDDVGPHLFRNSHDGVCLWQLPGPKDGKIRHVECWRVAGWPIVVFFYEPDGWDVFTAYSGLGMAQSLADAEVRLGLTPARDAVTIPHENGSSE